VVSHSFGELGVAFAANMHLIAACPNFTLANQEDGYRELADDVIAGGPMRFHGPRATVPDGPGLGVTLDSERVQHYADYYRHEVGERGLDRGLNSTLYKAMYLRPYLTGDVT
jgi:glucarate dehydratase